MLALRTCYQLLKKKFTVDVYTSIQMIDVFGCGFVSFLCKCKPKVLLGLKTLHKQIFNKCGFEAQHTVMFTNATKVV